jgi:hypothetical protein
MEHERNVSDLRSQLDSETLEKAWAIGARMTLEQAIDYLLDMTKHLENWQEHKPFS